MYTITPSPQFDKKYRQLTQDIRRYVDKTLDLLRENPYHPSLHTHKRRGEKEVWQARVTRNYRLYFEMEGDIIRLVSVVPHEK